MASRKNEEAHAERLKEFFRRALEPSDEGEKERQQERKNEQRFRVFFPFHSLRDTERKTFTKSPIALSHSCIRPLQLEMDGALAAVLPRPVSLGAGGAIVGGGPTEAATTRAGNPAGSTSPLLRPSSTSSSNSASSSPKLHGLVLVSDSLGADAAFVISHLLLKCLRDGQRVVLVATAESGPHYEAVLKKLGLSTSSLSPPSSSLRIVPLWDDDALWMPDSMRMLSCGATGLKRAAQAIAEAVGEEEAEVEPEEAAENENRENDVALVFDSLSALQAAARNEGEWEAFVAREVLGAAASCVIARTDCVPGDGRRAGGHEDDGCGSGEEEDAGTAAGGAAGPGSPSSPSPSAPPPWLAALRSSASVELTTRPLASGAALDVSGVLVARRGVTATTTATTKRQGTGGEETTAATATPPSLASLSLVSTPLTHSLALLPPHSRAVFNYRLVDAAVRLTPRRNV